MTVIGLRGCNYDVVFAVTAHEADRCAVGWFHILCVIAPSVPFTGVLPINPDDPFLFLHISPVSTSSLFGIV